MKSNVLIGNDVEFILTKGGVPFSAIGLVGGSKKFPSKCNLGALQEDNVLAEINIHPATTPEQWENNITEVVKELQRRVSPDDVSISTLASAMYGEDQLSTPEAQEFGCDPDMCAWEKRVNKFVRLTGKLKNLRSAGGHVHIGIPNLTDIEKFNLIKVMDTFIGLQTVILDTDKQRKKLYGKAGAMRFKPYGVEWRVPSNFWAHTPEMRKWMFDSAHFCASNFDRLVPITEKIPVTQIINTNNAHKAKKELLGLRAIMEFPLKLGVGE